MAIANDVDYGLGGGLWTRDLSRAHVVARRIRSGMVWVNSYKRVNPGSPFGGTGLSGYGREMGFEAMREYTEPKSVWVNVDADLPPFYPRPGSERAAFSYNALPGRVVFGAGSFERAADEIERLGASRILLIADRSGAGLGGSARGSAGARLVAPGRRCPPHVPIERAEAARGLARETRRGPGRDAGRRLGDRAGQGRRTRAAAAHPGHPHDLCRLRDDAHLGSYRGRPQGDGARPAGAASHASSTTPC